MGFIRIVPTEASKEVVEITIFEKTVIVELSNGTKKVFKLKATYSEEHQFLPGRELEDVIGE